jgi:hypothetical protein
VLNGLLFEFSRAGGGHRGKTKDRRERAYQGFDPSILSSSGQLCDPFSKPIDRFFRLSYGRSRVVTFFQKLFSKKSEPVKRVRVCVECGMPVAEHKDWCSIYRTQQEMAKKGPSAASA